MKVFCPKCKNPITLDYLEQEGGQIAACKECKVLVSATHEKSGNREKWDIVVERPIPKPKKVDPWNRRGYVIGIIFLVIVIFVLYKACTSPLPDEQDIQLRVYGNSQVNY